MKNDLHTRLMALQTDAELERKWAKAQGRHSNQFWAQEWLDVAHRRAEHLAAFFNSQQELGEPFSKVLHENLWDLYAR